MAAVLPIVAVAGLGVSVYGQIKAAQDEAQARREKAANEEAQAVELMSREDVNESRMMDQERQQELNFGSRAAAAGGEGTTLGGMLELHRQSEQAISFARRDAEFKAKMIRAGAQIDTNLASDAITAGTIGAAGSLLTGAAKAYDLYRGPSGAPQSLPTPPTGT
jgi:uncharacterized protein HemX